MTVVRPPVRFGKQLKKFISMFKENQASNSGLMEVFYFK